MVFLKYGRILKFSRVSRKQIVLAKRSTNTNKALSFFMAFMALGAGAAAFIAFIAFFAFGMAKGGAAKSAVC